MLAWWADDNMTDGKFVKGIEYFGKFWYNTTQRIRQEILNLNKKIERLFLIF